MINTGHQDAKISVENDSGRARTLKFTTLKFNSAA